MKRLGTIMKLDDTWMEIPVGTQVQYWDDATAREFYVFNLPSGESGWTSGTEQTPDPYIAPRKWRQHYFTGLEREQYVAKSPFRGGRETITVDGETDYTLYLAKQDTEKVYALVGMTQYINLGGFRSPPNINGARTTPFGQRLFLSQRFGKESTYFGNSRFDSTGSGREGVFNQRFNSLKLGWSTDPKGGYRFRLGIFTNSENPATSIFHPTVPKSYVPNSFSDPYQYRKEKIFK